MPPPENVSVILIFEPMTFKSYSIRGLTVGSISLSVSVQILSEVQQLSRSKELSSLQDFYGHRRLTFDPVTSISSVSCGPGTDSV